jgi:hypothetical protein
MKKLFITLSLAIISLGLSAQASANASQIKWTVVAKKTGANTAEVYFKATLAPTWHIWSQDAGDDMLIPPTFTFKDKDVVPMEKLEKLERKFLRQKKDLKIN